MFQDKESGKTNAKFFFQLFNVNLMEQFCNSLNNLANSKPVKHRSENNNSDCTWLAKK